MSNIIYGLDPEHINLYEVADEMRRQDIRWGEQCHPNGTGAWQDQLAAESLKQENDDAAKRGTISWRGILAEEVYEAFAERDVDRLREELVQVAAVACQWIKAIDRKCA